MVEALIFDVFGTVVDWRRGVAEHVAAFFSARDTAVDGTAFADAWRARYQPSMEPIRAGDRGYVPLEELHRENLDQVLERFGLADRVDTQDRDRLNEAWEKLPPWPDTVAGLTALKRHFTLAPCSNGSIAMMTRLALYGGLPWDAIVGAEIAGDYKPRAGVYTKSAAALGLEPEETMMVAAHNPDLHAARAAGLKTAFVARRTETGPDQTTDLEPTDDWDVVAEDFVDLAAQLVK